MTVSLFGRDRSKKRSLKFSDNKVAMKSTDCSEKSAMSSRWRKSGDMKDCSMIGPTLIEGMASCPCCNRQLKDGIQIVGETRLNTMYESLFKDDGSDMETAHSYDDMDEHEHMMPGVLSEGVPYTITQDLVQGWVHKKGTGMDWFLSRAWKPRWAVLSLARLSGHATEVPLLQIFWHSSSPTPSTVIHLDSAVVLPEDHPDTEKWSCSRFQIRHVKKSVDEHSVQVTRTFSCPREGRDAWCQAMNQALLEYEKEKAHTRRQSNYLSLSPPRWRSMVPWTTGDAHPSRAKDFAPIPTMHPTSPSSQPRNLPRHEPSLIGEALLAQAMES